MTLIVSGIMAIAHLYLGWRLTKASGFLSSSKLRRWLPVLLLLSFYALPAVGFGIYAINGGVDVLEIPKPITYWFWFGFAFSYQLLSWVIVLDIIKLGFHFGSVMEKNRINTMYGRFLITLAVLMMLFTGFKMYYNTNEVAVEHVELSVDELPDAFENLRIVHISDIQGDQYTGREQIARYIEQVNAQQPHLVIFTGDLISYGTDYIEMSAEEFARVEAVYGTFAVVGDHDYWAGLENVEPALESRGIELLRDENRYIPIGSDSLLLTGITQVYSQRAQQEQVRKLTEEPGDAVLKVLASHQVSEFLLQAAEDNGYRLLLAGHTHGGQVRVPLFGMTFSASDLETEFVEGLYQSGDLLVNVNNGLGFTLAPVRYNAPPAVTVITLSDSQE